MGNEGGMEGLGYLTLSRLNRHTCTHTCTHMHTNLGNVQWLLSRTQSLAIFLLSSASFVHVQTRAHKSPITTAYTCSCVPRVSGTDEATVVSGKRQEEPQTLACGADVTEVDKRWCRL